MNNNDKLTHRADQLLKYAKASGLNSVERELELLPKDDVVARIGYLANAINMQPTVAFDLDAEIGGCE